MKRFACLALLTGLGALATPAPTLARVLLPPDLTPSVQSSIGVQFCCGVPTYSGGSTKPGETVTTPPITFSGDPPDPFDQTVYLKAQSDFYTNHAFASIDSDGNPYEGTSSFLRPGAAGQASALSIWSDGFVIAQAGAADGAVGQAVLVFHLDGSLEGSAQVTFTISTNGYTSNDPGAGYGPLGGGSYTAAGAQEVDTDVAVTLNFHSGVPFALSAAVNAVAYATADDTSTADFFNTGYIKDIQLPAGATIRSYNDIPIRLGDTPTSVPEPSALGLVLAGLVATAATRWSGRLPGA